MTGHDVGRTRTSSLAGTAPHAWLERHLDGFFATHRQARNEGLEHRALSVADLVADDGAQLRPSLEMLREGGSPLRAAGKYLAGWFGGVAASAIGTAYVSSGACFLATSEGTRWQLHPSLWPDRVGLGAATAVVAPGHLWSGLPGTITVADPTQRAAQAVTALADTLRPLVATLRELSGVGTGALWAEVCDGLGTSLAYQPTIPPSASGIAALEELAGAKGAPWRSRPTLWIAESSAGPVCVMQKGGCCLAHTEPNSSSKAEDMELFGEPVGSPGYCSNCRHRTAQGCEDRQVWRRLDT